MLNSFNLLTLTVEASSPIISRNPTISAPVAVAVIPDKVIAPAAYATLFQVLIIIHPDAGIAPDTTGAAVREEYTHISSPEAPP